MMLRILRMIMLRGDEKDDNVDVAEDEVEVDDVEDDEVKGQEDDVENDDVEEEDDDVEEDDPSQDWTTLCARLRSRNAFGHCKRATFFAGNCRKNAADQEQGPLFV